MVCGTAALHRQASTAVQQLVFENRVFKIMNISSDVVVMCVTEGSALFEFDTYLCVCVFIKLHITAQSGTVVLVTLCHSH